VLAQVQALAILFKDTGITESAITDGRAPVLGPGFIARPGSVSDDATNQELAPSLRHPASNF
jgi:hypothetical protein